MNNKWDYIKLRDERENEEREEEEVELSMNNHK
jgi:hypothetical protein